MAAVPDRIYPFHRIDPFHRIYPFHRIGTQAAPTSICRG